MKSFFGALLLVVALLTVAISAQELTNHVMWSPYTKDFKLLQFLIPVNMKYFSTKPDDNTYLISLDLAGVVLDGDAIDIKATSYTNGKAGEWSQFTAGNFSKKSPLKISFPKFPITDDATIEYSRHVNVYIKVKSLTKPAVKVTVESATEKDKKIVDKNSYSEDMAQTLGSMTVALSKNNTMTANKTPESTQNFVIKFNDFSPSKLTGQLFTIDDVAPSGGKFVQRTGSNGPACKIDGKDIAASVANGPLSLPADVSKLPKSFTLECPGAGFAPGIGDSAFLAAWDDVNVRFTTQAYVNHASSGGRGRTIAVVIIILLILAAAAGGLYYFFVIKKKQPVRKEGALIGNDFDGGY